MLSTTAPVMKLFVNSSAMAQNRQSCREVVGVDVGYTRPREQTVMEEGNMAFWFNRLAQLQNILGSAEAMWKEHTPKQMCDGAKTGFPIRQ